MKNLCYLLVAVTAFSLQGCNLENVSSGHSSSSESSASSSQGVEVIESIHKRLTGDHSFSAPTAEGVHGAIFKLFDEEATNDLVNRMESSGFNRDEFDRIVRAVAIARGAIFATLINELASFEAIPMPKGVEVEMLVSGGGIAKLYTFGINQMIDDVSVNIVMEWDFPVIGPSASLSGGRITLTFLQRSTNITEFSVSTGDMAMRIGSGDALVTGTLQATTDEDDLLDPGEPLVATWTWSNPASNLRIVIEDFTSGIVVDAVLVGGADQLLVDTLEDGSADGEFIGADLILDMNIEGLVAE